MAKPAGTSPAAARPAPPREVAAEQDIIPMRPDERLDAARVGAFLEGRIEGCVGTPEILQFGRGKANLTYLLRYPQAEYVLRRPPLGPVAPKSHDMAREFRVLSRLYRAYALAPRAYVFSDDPALVGAPCFVMERRNGIVIGEQMPAGYRDDPALNARVSAMVVDALADLHRVDPAAVDLQTLGRPQGFTERQVNGWAQRWEGAKTADVPNFYRLHKWLQAHLPRNPPVALVHNDFKLNNMMVAADDPARAVAVFDWDMCTLGDPLVDLGTLLGYWVEAGDVPARHAFSEMPTSDPGMYSRRQIVERYARHSALELSSIAFYEIFALFKTSVVLQQIYVRLHRGQTQDERFRPYGANALALIDATLDMTT